MTDVDPELLPEHPVLELRAVATDNALGVMAGETLAYRCRECGAADEDCFEIIHEDDCRLAGETAPTAYADRPTSFDARQRAKQHGDVDLAADGGHE